jgi:hypothetical protein
MLLRASAWVRTGYSAPNCSPEFLRWRGSGARAGEQMATEAKLGGSTKSREQGSREPCASLPELRPLLASISGLRVVASSIQRATAAASKIPCSRRVHAAAARARARRDGRLPRAPRGTSVRRRLRMQASGVEQLEFNGHLLSPASTPGRRISSVW